MNTKTVLTLVAILFLTFSGCDRTKQVLTPDVSTPDTVSVVKIGVIQPSGYYTSFHQGAELARVEINNTGGTLGKQVEFIVMDNQGERPAPDAAESVQIAKTLIEQEGVVAILGPIFSNNSMQVGPVVQQLERPIIPGSAGGFVTAAGDFVFLVVPSTSVQGLVMAQFATDMIGLAATTAATIRQSNSAYTEGLTTAFEENFEKLGGEIVSSEVYQFGNETFNVQLSNIKATEPDVLYIAGVIPDIHFVMAEARDIGIEATFLGMDSWDEPEKLFSTLSNNRPLEDAYFTVNFNVELPGAENFVSDYTALSLMPPDSMAAAGYDAMSLLDLAIENAQTLNPSDVRDALSNITDYQGATFISHYDVNRHPVKDVVINTIRNGHIERHIIVSPRQ